MRLHVVLSRTRVLSSLLMSVLLFQIPGRVAAVDATLFGPLSKRYEVKGYPTCKERKTC